MPFLKVFLELTSENLLVLGHHTDLNPISLAQTS